jgi:hypothetical protein
MDSRYFDNPFDAESLKKEVDIDIDTFLRNTTEPSLL